MAALPEELIEDVLSTLAVKSLLRFKTASKNWYSLLSKNHNFAKFHLKQCSSSSSKNLIFYHTNCEEDRYASVLDVDIITNSSSRRISFPVEIAMPCRVIGSANGLICLASIYGIAYYMWNPCTGECKKISVPFLESCFRLLGFGYDSISDDYKIVGGRDNSLIGIFSLKRNSWKKLEYSIKLCPYRESAFYSNGALHWYSSGLKITVFDLAKDQILFLDLPEGIKDFGIFVPFRVPLFDYQGSLCVSGRKSIWVLKEYGNSKSWTRLTTSLPQEYANPVGISRFGELVFYRIDGSGCVKSNIKGRMSDGDKLRIDNFGVAFVYKESLISPRYLN